MVGTSRVIAAMLASVLVAGPALAQPKPPSDKDKALANDLVKQAIAKSQAKEHLDAIDLYLKAYAVVPLPTLLSNVGTEFQQANKPVEALKYFCMYLEKDPAGPLVTYASAQAKVLQTQLGNAVDDKDVCKASTPPPPPDGPQTGTGTGAPGDGTTLGVTSATPEPHDPGKTFKLAGIAASGVGVVAIGAGIFFGLRAKSISDDITNHTNPDEPWPDDIRDQQDRGQRYENMQIGFMVAGGVLAIGGAALYMLGRSKTSESLTVTPTATPGGGGVVFSGRF